MKTISDRELWRRFLRAAKAAEKNGIDTRYIREQLERQKEELDALELQVKIKSSALAMTNGRSTSGVSN